MKLFSPEVTLAEVCHFIVDSEHKTAPTQGEGHPLIRTPNIGKGRFILDGVQRVSDETFRAWTKRAVPRAGDLILAREAPVGNVALVQPGMQVCLGQRTVLIRPNEALVDPAYLTYLLLGDEIQGHFHSVSNGATVHHLNLKDLRALRLPRTPPLPTQRKIAAILSAYDDLIENNTRRVRVLEEMARALYREWFVEFRFPGHATAEFVEDEQGHRPKGWEWGRLDDCLILQRGFDLPTKQRVNGPYPIFASTGLNGYHNEKKVSGPGVVTGRSGSLGTVMLVLEDFWPLNTTLWVKEFKHVQPVYAYYLLSSLDLAQYNAGAAVPTLNRNDIHGSQIILPPQPLLQTFEELAMTLHQKIETLHLRNANLRRTRDLLLPRLVSGELDVSALDVRGPGLDAETEVATAEEAVA